MPSPPHRFQDRYGELLALCDAIESIADSIAGRVDRELCIATAERMSSLKLGQATEVPRRTEANPWAATPKSPLDVADALRSVATGRGAFSWQAIDSMLRTFLEGLRRHVAAEQAMIEAMKRSKRPN
ncbi:hypothetical protein [Sinorhizobium fredii]